MENRRHYCESSYNYRSRADDPKAHIAGRLKIYRHDDEHRESVDSSQSYEPGPRKSRR